MEIQNVINSKGINSLVLIKNPAGAWNFVGKVPTELAYVNATPEQIKAAQFGGRFGPKTRVFKTKNEAVLFAFKHDQMISQIVGV